MHQASNREDPAQTGLSMDFYYLHEELRALRHDEPENHSRGESRKRAENYKQPPALEIQ